MGVPDENFIFPTGLIPRCLETREPWHRWELAGGLHTGSELHARPENSADVNALRKCTYAVVRSGTAPLWSEWRSASV